MAPPFSMNEIAFDPTCINTDILLGADRIPHQIQYL
ncbi:hypothetical protein CCACVL1_00010 [Corchorus capsularis]|uniref:Uncharacterized protein n=1 Tax=Corchorus capsularis TaxID=210143 RepID=A0A1R3KZB2_COCAP|nr:hypothetical protein CCACVL1_00010 [Corchorus capsularis]